MTIFYVLNYALSKRHATFITMPCMSLAIDFYIYRHLVSTFLLWSNYRAAFFSFYRTSTAPASDNRSPMSNFRRLQKAPSTKDSSPIRVSLQPTMTSTAVFQVSAPQRTPPRSQQRQPAAQRRIQFATSQSQTSNSDLDDAESLATNTPQPNAASRSPVPRRRQPRRQPARSYITHKRRTWSHLLDDK